ncbi:sulfotransferase family protein [Streptomyces sp. NPDC059627]
MVDVIGVGFGRTGTASLAIALDQLGLGPCYHMTQVLERPDRARRWLTAWRDRDTADPASLLSGYRSTVDWPGAAFWRELVDAFPQAKVVLTVRDPQRWYDSASSTIFRAALDRDINGTGIGHRLLRTANPWLRGYEALERELILDGVFGGRFADREYAIDVFTAHIEAVRSYVPADRLLVHNVADGWPALCAHLGVEPPDGPFPNVNHGGDFRRFERGWQLRGVIRRPIFR